MLPLLFFDLNDFYFTVYTNSLLYIFTYFIALSYFLLRFSGKIAILKVLFLISLTSICSILGGRLFHVIVERPSLLDTPRLIFTQLQGLTFYGALAGGAVAFVLFIKVFKLDKKKGELFDSAAVVLAFSYGILRIGCFLQGCCWGKLTTLPWAVQYFNINSTMPALGIPVHPVQLYDSLFGFMIALIIIYLSKIANIFKENYIYIFCLLFAITRFLTEEWRGDTYRGIDVFFGFSTSQTVSMLVFILSAYKLLKIKPCIRYDSRLID